jgi:hypothetical protein
MEQDKNIKTSHASQTREKDKRPQTWTPRHHLMHHLRLMDSGKNG